MIDCEVITQRVETFIVEDCIVSEENFILSLYVVILQFVLHCDLKMNASVSGQLPVQTQIRISRTIESLIDSRKNRIKCSIDGGADVVDWIVALIGEHGGFFVIFLR